MIHFYKRYIERMAEDEYDYMSDNILAHCTQSGDIRPGLKRSHASLREHELDKKKQRIYEEQQLLRKVRKTPWELEQEKRDPGL